MLWSERGAHALSYFRNRGLSDETIKKFGLGYSDQYSDDLFRYLRRKGYEEEILRDTGLVTIDERRGGYDKFWNRAMFPIMDVHSKVIGFGGRVMGDGEPKYLNSPETKIFDKSRNLYGLHLARSTKKQQLLLCEGYMDVIALHQAGFDNAVASLGTSLTAGHANLLKRYTKEVYLTYDSDGAGVKAALRAIPILKEAGITAKVISMKPSKDPDEFIKAFGAEAYQERIDAAENSFLFEIRILEQQYDMRDPEGKTSFFQEAAKRLCGFTEKIERDNYIEAIAEKYRIKAEDLHRLVGRYGMQQGLAGGVRSPAGRRYTDTDADQGPPETGRRNRKKEDGMKQSQKLLLTWLSEDTGLFEKIRGRIGPGDFTEEIYHRAAEILFAQYEADGAVNPAGIVSIFEKEEDQREIAAIFHARVPDEMTKEDRKKAMRETVLRVKENSIRQRSQALAPDDMEGMMQLIADKRALEQLERMDHT